MMSSDTGRKNKRSNTGVWAGSHPDREQCMQMLADYGTPAHVIGHCKAVAAVGYILAKALNERCREMDGLQGTGQPLQLHFDLDLDLILAAGLLHDMARVEDMHWEAAARFCEVRGMQQEADIIRVHMTYDPFNDLAHLNETDVICLADRTVLEDRYAGLERRIDYIIEKARRNGHPEHEPHILRKKAETRVLIDAIEAFLGCSMDALMEGLDYEHPEQA